MEISVLTWTNEPCSTFVVVVGEALDPGDDRDDEVDEDTGDAKTGNETLRITTMFKYVYLVKSFLKNRENSSFGRFKFWRSPITLMGVSSVPLRVGFQ